MTTSGTTELGYTVNQILEEAYDALGVAADGETLSGNLFARGKKSLNMLLRQWQGSGMHLWTMTEGYLFPTKGDESFSLATARVVNAYSRTTTSAAASSTDTTVTLTSVTGITNGLNIGILMDDNTMHWTTVNGAPAGNVVTLTDALTGDVNNGAVVFTHDGTFRACQRIRQVRRIDSSTYEIPMQMYARADYMALPNKAEQSVPVVAYVSRQLSASTIYLWPTVNREDIVIPFTYERVIEAVTASTETLDVPEYWFPALYLNLAVLLATKMGTNPQRYQVVLSQAQEALAQAMTFDTEVSDWRLTCR